MANDHDPALAAFLGASPADFEFAREEFRNGMNFPTLRAALRNRNVKAEQIDRIVQDVASALVEPLVLGQTAPMLVINRLVGRGLTNLEAEAVLTAIHQRNDRRLFARGFTEPKANAWIDMILSLFGIFRFRR